jgi:dienelactone hydrolase
MAVLTRTSLGLLLLALAVASPASAGSLYSGPAPRPGPDILYRAPADAPQLDNTGVWHAKPILVSGASAYRDGEFLYQDFLFDDHGANGGQRDSNDPRSAGDTFAAPNGTYTYPTNRAYADNAADIVELRVKRLADATAFRLTLNTLKDPSLVGTTIAIGSSTLPRSWPHGANVSSPAALFLTVHGSTGELIDAATGKAVTPTPTVSIDRVRRQIEIRVPHSGWNPGTGTVRLAAGVGLWDKAANKYLLPQGDADDTHPGGAGTLSDPPAFFNTAFRYDEPLPEVGNIGADLVDTRWWRDNEQGHALANGDMSSMHADVDFGKLAAGTDDDMPGKHGGVPQNGPMDRIVASHFETEQGANYSPICDDTIPAGNKCFGELRSRLQPYSIYIPKKPPPAGGYGLTLLIHSHAAMYNQFLGSRNQSQFGERGPGSIVITPAGRGVDGWTWDYASADLFEVWADVASRWKLDADYTSIAGYSMGGYSTYKLATEYPDLFARAQPTVGPPGVGVWTGQGDPSGGAYTNTYNQLESVRNVPFLIWVAASDELVPYPGTQTQRSRFDSLGLRYEFDTFAPAEHLSLAFVDQFQPAADFLGTARVDRNPAHVTYVYNPKMEHAVTDAPANHAYWLYGLGLRSSAGDHPLGTVDVRSEGFGVGDPAPGGTQAGAGTLTGGNVPALGYQSLSKSWGATPKAPVRDRLNIEAKNIRSVSVNVARARVDCNVFLHVTSDGPITVNLPQCGEAVKLSGSGDSPGACRDRLPPRARVARHGVKRSHGRLVVRGRASDRGCKGSGSLRSRRGVVARVGVSVARVHGHRCRFLKRKGGFTSARKCRRAIFLPARGTKKWRLRTRKLPRGRYHVRARAIDGAGNRSPGRRYVRFTLR